MQSVKCCRCSRPCVWVPVDEDALPQFGGWYCEPCDEYTETEADE